MDKNDEDLLTCEEAALLLRLKNPKTLAVWRSTKRYPLPYIRLGRRSIRYRLRDLKEFLEKQRIDG